MISNMCIVCGNIFWSSGGNAKYCSDECSNSRHIVNCKVCGKEYRSPFKHNGYCSEECRNKSLNKTCTVCGKPFFAASNNAKYCSDECRNNAFTNKCIVCNKEFKSRLKTDRYCSKECKEKPVDKKCVLCGNTYQLPYYKAIVSKYCSNTCRTEANRQHIKEYQKRCKPNQKDHQEQIRETIEEEVRLIVTELIKDLRRTGKHLNGMTIDYWNTSFTESIKEQVKKRDGYACRICKKDTDLHVHHRIKRKNGGDHSLENLITLCSSCHRAVETGDLAHAIRKCTQNAFKHYHIPVVKLEEKLNKLEERAQTRSDLKQIFRLIVEDEKEEALVLLDKLIERYDG